MRFTSILEKITAHLREDAIWPWFFRSIQIASLALGFYWWLWKLPVPGYAIGVLAVLAAVMSLHIEARVQWWDKSVWMLLMGAFLVLEFKAINEDRRIQDETHRNELAAQAKANQNTITTILNTANEQSAQNQRQFKQTLDQMKGVATTSQHALNFMTGGDSYLDFGCTDIVGPSEIALQGLPKGVMVGSCIPELHGQFPLQVHVSMFGPGPMGRWERDYGTVYPLELGKSREGLTLMFYPEDKKVAVFVVLITTSNGNYGQTIIVKKVGARWLWASRYYKHEGNKTKLIRTFSAPGFPAELLDEHSDWDKL